MRIGILELLTESVSQTWGEHRYNLWYKKILASITPQAVAVWCRQLGHHVSYATYYGQRDPKRLLPGDLDMVFIATYTQASALAYALSKLYRREKTVTVIGGQQFPLMTCESSTTYVGGRLSEHFDHPFLSFEATCTIRTDTIPGGKQVHFAVQAELRHGDGK